MGNSYTKQKVTTFQKRFSDLIESSGKTITAIAKDLHVSNQTISAWKIGTRSPKSPTVIVIADYFGVTVEWLMGFDVEKTKNENGPDHSEDPEIRIVSGMMETMSQEQKQQVIDLIKILVKQKG